MARDTGPVTRKSRRLRVDLVGGDMAFERRPYPPGQAGRARIKESEYLLQLQEKQKARFTYGVLEKPLENAPALEYDRSPNPLRDELTIGVPALVDGFVPIPTAPGLGIEIDPEVLEKYVGDKG